MLVPRTRAHTQLTWGVTTSRHRQHVAARPSQSKVLRKGHEREQHSREHVITHIQNRTWRCLIRWWWRRTAWPLPWWGRRRKRRKRHAVHGKSNERIVLLFVSSKKKILSEISEISHKYDSNDVYSNIMYIQMIISPSLFVLTY